MTRGGAQSDEAEGARNDKVEGVGMTRESDAHNPPFVPLILRRRSDRATTEILPLHFVQCFGSHAQNDKVEGARNDKRRRARDDTGGYSSCWKYRTRVVSSPGRGLHYPDDKEDDSNSEEPKTQTAHDSLTHAAGIKTQAG
jgi:hypothetical protein